MKVDAQLLRVYDRKAYNCLHFTRDVWGELTGEDISEKLRGLLGAPEDRRLALATFRAFERLPRPISHCLVYMRSMGRDPHVGVFFRDRLLHMRTTGPEFLPLAIGARGFNSFRFYK